MNGSRPQGPASRTGKPGFRALRRAVGSVAALIGLGLTAAAAAPAAPVLPQGGAFIAGQGQIGTPSAGALTINQQSAKGVIDWNSFSIGAGGAVTINNGTGATLNRVTGASLSEISGRLSATGSVYLVNPQGVVVSSTGQVLGGGSVVLSSRDIPTAGFMSGSTVTASGNTAGDVTNAGTILSKSGNVVLIGRSVNNAGDITASNGSVSLNAANSVLMSDGASGIYVAPDASASGDVTQEGQIQAAAAQLTAAGGNVYALAGNRGGAIQATGTTTVNGEVWLTAPNGDVSVAGKVVARNLDGSGGKIVAAGARTTSVSGLLDASGVAGGTILVGVTAQKTNLSDTTALADSAQIIATGMAGNGGYVETSGHDLQLNAALVKTGAGGTWLLDPNSMVINSTGTGNAANTDYRSTAQIATDLANNGTVNLTSALDLTVASPVTCSNCSNSTLHLEAGRSMYITAPITLGGALELVAATDLQQGNSQLYIGSDGSSDFNAPITARSVNINSQSNLIIKSGITSAGTGNTDTMKLYAASYLQLVNSQQVTSATDASVQAQYYQMELDPGSKIQAAGDIRIQTDWFNNLGDATVLQPGTNNHYYIYTTKPSQITLGGLAATSADFVQYNATFDKDTPANTTTPLGTGNGVLYSFAPVLQYTVTGNVTKIYDGTTTATGLSLSNITNITGLQTGDTLQMSGTTGSFSQADVGQNIAVTLPTVSVTHTANSVTQSVYGYVISATQNQGIIGTIKPAPLTVSFNNGPITKTYDGGNDAPVSPTDLTVTGWVAGQGGSVKQITSSTYASANAGNPAVTVKLEASGFNLTGATKITNYTLDPTSATQVYNLPITGTGQINPAALTVVIKGNPGVTQSGGNNPNATLSAANYDISGLRGSDAASVSQTVGVWNSSTGVGAQQLTANVNGQINFSSGSASNYTLPTTATGYGTVTASTPVGIGVTVNKALTMTYYGQATYNGSSASTTFVANDFTVLGNPGDVTVDPTKVLSIVFATPNAGVQPFTVTVDTSRVSDQNYNFYRSVTTNLATAGPLQSQITGQGTINKYVVTVTAPSVTKVYDGTSRGVVTGITFNQSLVGSDSITINSAAGNFQDGSSANTPNVASATKVVAGLSYTAGGSTLLTNYDLPTSISVANSTITPAPLVAQIINNPTKTYDTNTTAAGANSSVGLVSSNFQLRGFIGSESITVNHSAGTYGDKNAGVQSITASLNAGDFTAGAGTQLSNYAIPQVQGDAALVANGSGTINPINVTVTGVTTTDKSYDKSTYITTNGGSISSSVLGNDDVQLITGHGDTATADVGTAKTVTATGYALSGADGANYRIVQPINLTVNISKAPISLTVQKTYDGTNDASSTVSGIQYNFTGVYNGDTIGIAPTGTFSQTDVGTGLGVNLTNSGLTGSSAGNYQITTTSGTITKANLTVTLADQTKVYDGTTADTIGSGQITITGVHGETATASNLPTSGTYDTADAGTNTKTVTANLSGATISATNGAFKASNYNALPTTVTNTHSTITPKALTITLDNQTKVYDGTTAVTPALTSNQFHVSGLVNGETLTITQTAASYTDANAGAGNKTVNATIRSGNTDFFTGGGATTQFNAANYSFSNVVTNTTSTITPLGVSIDLTRVTKVYDGTTALPTASSAYTLSGVVNGDQVTVASASGSYDTAGVGTTHTITLNGNGITLGGAQAGNYTVNALASNNQIGTITPAPLTVTITGGPNKTYDATTVATLGTGNYQISGLVNGETTTVNVTTGAYNSKDVVTANTVTTTLGSGSFNAGTGGFNINNYTFNTTASGAGTISARSLTATIAAQTKTYDANTTAAGLTAASYTVNGLQGGETLAINRTSGVYNSKDVASASGVTVANLVSGDFTGGNGFLASNYSLPTSATGPGTIAARQLAAALNAQTKVYDGNTNLSGLTTGSYQITGLQGGETLVINRTSGTYNSKDVGVGTTVTVANLVGGDFTGGNGFVSGNYILPLQAQNTASAITKKTLTISITPAQTKVYDATTTASGLTSGNFQISGLVGSESATIGATSGAYNSKDVATATTVTVALTAGSFSGSNGFLAGNYDFSGGASGAGTITARPLTLAIVGGPNKLYDGTTAATLTSSNYSLSGLQGGETASISGGTGAYNSKDVLTANTVSVTGLTAANYTGGNGFLASNYTLAASGSGAGTISARTLTATLAAQTKVYDGTTAVTPAVTSNQYTVNGLQNGETLAVSQAVATYDNANVGSGNKTVTAVLGSGNLTGGNGFLASNYVLPVQAINTTSSITPLSVNVGIDLTHVVKVYDGTTALPTASSAYTLSGVVNGDSVSVASASGAYLSPNVGNGIGMNITSVTLGGAQAGNYVVNPVASGALIGEITPLTLTAAIINNPTKVYDGASTALLGPGNFSLTGFVGGQGASVTQTAGLYASPNAGSQIGVTATLAGGDFTANSGTLLSNYILPTIAQGPGAITPRPVTAVIIGNPTKDFDGTPTATLTPVNYQLTGLLDGQTLTVTQTSGTYDDPAPGGRTVTALLNPGFFTPGGGALLGNYSLPGSATGPGLINARAVIVQTDEPSVFSSFTAALAARGVSLADAAPVQRLVRSSIMTMATPRIYIPFPAEGALSTWKGNGFGSLPIVVDQTTNAARVVSIDGNVATQSGPPMINNTEQVLLTGVRNKQYRIIITSQAANGPTLADQ